MLNDQRGLMVVGQLPAGPELSERLDAYRPDAVVWDLGWDPSATLESIVELREVGTPVVVLLPNESLAREAWASGVRGLLLRDTDGPILAMALRAAAKGLTVLAPELAAVARPSTGGGTAPPVEALTPREQDVLHLLAQGLPNKAIAQRLGVTEHTVKFHLNAILGKLGAQSRTEAVVLAARMGLIPL
jgi:DNA-binding NarL/FixJ family response regulator